jgi:CRP-like cAMP-binding protein
VGAIGAFAGSGRWTAVTTAIVQTPGRVLAIPAPCFQGIVAPCEEIRDRVLRYQESLLVQVQQTAACNALHSLESRLVRWLLEAHDRAETATISVTQEFLSQMLGVRRTSVTVAVGNLQSRALIRQHRASVEIVDRHGLEAAACECYAALRRRMHYPFSEYERTPV